MLKERETQMSQDGDSGVDAAKMQENSTPKLGIVSGKPGDYACFVYDEQTDSGFLKSGPNAILDRDHLLQTAGEVLHQFKDGANANEFTKKVCSAFKASTLDLQNHVGSNEEKISLALEGAPVDTKKEVGFRSSSKLSSKLPPIEDDPGETIREEESSYSDNSEGD